MTGFALLKPAAAAMALSLILAGCSLAPVYERPKLPVDGSYGPAAASPSVAVDSAPAAEVGWSEFFRDPRLHALIDLALENNRDLRIAVGRVEEARAVHGITRSDQFPTIGIGANAQHTRNPRDMRMGDDSVSRVYMAGIGLTSFELDFFGRLSNLSEAAFQQYLATEQAQQTVVINLVAQVAEAYFRYRTAQELKGLMLKTQESRQETFDMVQARYDIGVASALDINQARSQLQAVKADLSAIDRQQARALNALELLVGTSVPGGLPAAAIFGKDQLLASIPAGLPSDLLARRPDILGAEHSLKSRNADIGAARAAFFPNISITGLLGFASPQLGGLFGSGNRYWQYSPQLQTPIFGGGQRGALDVAEARKDIAIAEYEKAIQQAFREVADALAGEATYADELDALRELEQTRLEAVELARIRYETGVDSFLQVQTAEVALYTTQQQFLQLGMESLLNRIELYKALGGGWTKSSVNTSQLYDEGLNKSSE